MIRTLLFFIALGINTTIGGIGVMVIGLFQRHSKIALEWIMKPWAKSLVWIAGIKLTVEGVENVDFRQSYIVLSNHQSHMDIPVLLAAMPNHFTFIAKKELFRIPIFAQAMRGFGILEIDRSNRNRAIATLKDAAQIAKSKNISILAFPEGTRSEDGQLKPFKKGPFMLALDARLPVLPVSISGTFPILPKGKLLIRGGQQVRVTIHPPVIVENASYESREQLMDETYQRVASGFMQYES